MPTPKYTHVVSSTPGRTRLRVSPKRRNHQEMARIANALKAHPEVHEVRTNVQTGSIVVHHAHNDRWHDEMIAILQDLGIILGSVADVEEPLSGGKSEVAADITSVVKDLNERFGLVTNGVVDLRMLFPMGLAALSLRELMQNEWEFEAAPWYVLAWYAFDSFIKLHNTSDPEPSTTPSTEK
ncbi:MAG: HMA2 domain-containing protein [Cyanobacteriota bacterium]